MPSSADLLTICIGVAYLCGCALLALLASAVWRRCRSFNFGAWWRANSHKAGGLLSGMAGLCVIYGMCRVISFVFKHDGGLVTVLHLVFFPIAVFIDPIREGFTTGNWLTACLVLGGAALGHYQRGVN